MIKDLKVLALKYRPLSFDDLIGQNIVAETITNSIKFNKVPNAYLFTGIRGVGKTTTARIVAKALNCLNGFEKVCKVNFCQNCEEIQNSNSLDCLEVDGASNTGIDSVKELLEFSRYKPATSKYKIIIIDEIQMLSKSAFASLLKTLEEPPLWIKFIFCTTEVKKIPVTIISRCQRFDLSRVKSDELFKYIKKIKDLEKGNANDDALKLIVKISEGSVRDSLSLLDRALMSLDEGEEFDLNKAQKIFGYFDKSQLINLFEFIFEGKQKEVLEIYRSIYDQGIEPKIFLNDFLEILYYFKNINSLKIDGNNFSLNDSEYNSIKKISNKIEESNLLLFWQFTVKTLGELDVVSNQNLSIEMFLIRLIHLIKINDSAEKLNHEDLKLQQEETHQSGEPKFQTNEIANLKNKTIGQIKNVVQEKKLNKELQDVNKNKELSISSFAQLLDICVLKREAKLKYELEKNVNLVSFEQQRIQISFNEDLDKDFIKILSSKLYVWTNKRWIISLSKEKGSLSIKEKEANNKKKIFEKKKESEMYKKVLQAFPDAEMTDAKIIKGEDNE